MRIGGFEEYEPEFTSAEQVREMLIDEGLFDDDLRLRTVVLALEVLSDRHNIGKGAAGYEVTSAHLYIITQLIDADTTFSCDVDIS